ncbi:hypothetical protein IPA_04530 [Ignicoccus pacificus DSM 13166]|uniref:Damage-control phosphatase ARMT1-like metal-binding domain-containing protein n=1 Tax=Ignicoccus pacificus DSM 13166 TaxID=940294 RepID=A0A977KB87_9CREN|nr:hypothetical protein IPA_04530 [Ignicoccus pacificus DSM 13166]
MMKWREDCIRCLLDARIYDAFKGGATDKELQLILSSTVGSMQFPKSKAFRYSWKVLKEVLGDIYVFERRKLLERTLSKKLDVPQTLEDALRLAAMGNLHDTAVGGSYRPGTKELGKLITIGTDVLWNGGRMIYAVDNLPEVPYDVLAAKFFETLGWEVTMVAREESYEIDATYADLVELVQLLDKDGSIRVEKLPGSCTIFDRCEEAKELRENNDIVLAKGLLNADAYIDFMPPEPSLLVFAAKCQPLAEAVGAEIGDAVAVLGEILLKAFRG